LIRRAATPKLGTVFNPNPKEIVVMTAVTQTLTLRSASMLRKVLWCDALSCAAMSAMLLLFANPLQALLGLEPGFMRAAGATLLPFAAFVAWAASRERISRVAVGWIIAINALWVVDSLAILFFGWVQPTTLGSAFIVAQAVFVGVLVELEFVGLKREGRVD
jgi:hypothetical protein